MFDKEKEPYIKRAEKAYLAIGEMNWCKLPIEDLPRFVTKLEEIEKALTIKSEEQSKANIL